MKLFITGAQGFVGSKLIERCQAQDIEYTAVDIVDKTEANYIKADVGSDNISDLISDDTDVIVHLAGLTRDPDCRDKGYECFEANVMATLNLMNAAQAKGVKQFIFASSEWVYDSFKDNEVKDENSLINAVNLDSEYALSKFVGEQNLRQKYNHGFCDTTILRFGIIYGTRPKNWSAVEAIFNMVKNNSEVTVGSLKTGRCFLHVDDIVSGILKAVGKKGFEIINLQGNGLITLDDIIIASQKILDKKVVITEKDAQNISVRNVSNQKAKDVLDWAPMITLEDGLADLNELLTNQQEALV